MIEALIGVRFDTFDTSPGIMGTETANMGLSPVLMGIYTADLKRNPEGIQNIETRFNSKPIFSPF